MTASGFPVSDKELAAFTSLVWEMGAKYERTGLSWRHIDDAYGVYLSEVMLQQTQVSRVMSYWPRWMADFPTIDALAAASISDVLERWQGLGYNRRALACKKTAETCARDYQGHLPQTYEELLELPGIGPATAAGIVAFAYQKPSVYIETNVREVFISHFFADTREAVHDRDLIPLVEATCSTDDPRGWYYALLDFGAHLKSEGSRHAARSASYAKQSRFEGSWRQKRAFVVREALAAESIALTQMHEALNVAEEAAGRGPIDADQFAKLAEQLAAEGFFSIEGGKIVSA